MNSGRVVRFGTRWLRVIAIALAGLMTTASSAAAGTWPDWWSYDRPAEFESVRERVHVPMRDGARLACDLYRPGLGGVVAPGRFPGIVQDYTPYSLLYQLDARSQRGGAGWEYLARRGYNVLRCDVRGSGQSDGDYPSWFREIELGDNYELIEWFAAQPWSTGRIGQTGQSYGGITSYRVATRQPPHLVAIAPTEAASNIYDEMIYPGGMFSEYYAGAWSSVVMGTGQAEGWDVFSTFRSHPLFDEYWDQIAYDDEYDKIKVPVLGFGGWQDIFQWGMIESYEGVASNGDPQRKGPWLIVGPWQHGLAPDQAAVHPVPAGVFLAWWDHWLQQRPGAPLPSAAVTSFEQPLVGGGGWEELAAWPPPDSVKQRFHLRVDSGLAARPGLKGERSYDVKPDGPSRETLNEARRTEAPESDQAFADSRRITYTTPPLVDDVVVAGDPEVRLKAKLSEAEGAFIVKLEDVGPGGRVIETTTGHLKASHRLGHERSVPVTPNEVTEYVIPIKPTHWRFAKGHSIRVAVTSSDLPITNQQTERGTVTLLSGPDGSFIDLPIRTDAGPTPSDAATRVASASEQALACTTRRLVLADVIPGRRRVRLVGYADRRYVGRTVSIVFGRQGRRVARARVRRDGSFRTSAPLPPLSLRANGAARYQARLGGERSQWLKLMRRMRVTSVRVADRQVTIAGRIRGPLTRPRARVEVRRRVSCGRWEHVRWIRPDKRGRFRTTLAGRPERLAATYRFGTRVRVSSSSRRIVRTFTLPVHVDLG